MDKEKIIKEVKRAHPEALFMASMGVDPAGIRLHKGKKLKPHIKKLLTKYSRVVFNEK